MSPAPRCRGHCYVSGVRRRWEIMDLVTGPSLPFDPIEEARRQWIEHGWADVADGMAAVTSIMRAQQLFLGRVDNVLRPYELTFARYELLMLLVFSRTGALPLSRIGARLQVHA